MAIPAVARPADDPELVRSRLAVIYPALTTLLSVAGGLIGFRFAVSANPGGIHDYVLAAGIAALVQVPVSALAGHRRDRLAMASAPGKIVHARAALSVFIGTGLALAAAAGWVAFRRPVMGYLALSWGALALQQATFGHASWQQVRDLRRFWRVQLMGATARALGMGALVLALDGSYTGILISNLAAAAVVCAAYGQWPGTGRVGWVRLRRACGVGGHRLLTLDGGLRAAKQSFETVAIQASALAAEAAGGLSPEANQALLASVGYVGTLAVALRQLGARWERLQSGRPSPGVLALLLGGLGAAAFALQSAFGVFDVLLPRLGEQARLQIVAACVAYSLVYPATRGYLYADFASPVALKTMAARVMRQYPLALLCGVALLRLMGAPAAPLIAAATPVALALALRTRHA